MKRFLIILIAILSSCSSEDLSLNDSEYNTVTLESQDYTFLPFDPLNSGVYAGETFTIPFEFLATLCCVSNTSPCCNNSDWLTSEVNIDLIYQKNNSNFNYNIVRNFKTGSLYHEYNWEIPKYFPSGNYWLKIEDALKKQDSIFVFDEVFRGTRERSNFSDSFSIISPYSQSYLVGDWDKDGVDDIAVRRDRQLILDDKSNNGNTKFNFGLGDSEDEYLVGDWNDDGFDDIAVRRDNLIILNYNFDGSADNSFRFGLGNSEDEYLVGDWNGDGFDNIAVRRGNLIILDYNFDGVADKKINFGLGDSEDEYLVGDWNGDGVDDIAVRRDNLIILDYNFDGIADYNFRFGLGNSEYEYLVGDWNGDNRDDIGVRRIDEIIIDFDFNGIADKNFKFGLDF